VVQIRGMVYVGLLHQTLQGRRNGRICIVVTVYCLVKVTLGDKLMLISLIFIRTIFPYPRLAI